MAEGVEAASCVVRDVVPGAVKGNVLLVAWGLPANAVVQGPSQALRTAARDMRVILVLCS